MRSTTSWPRERAPPQEDVRSLTLSLSPGQMPALGLALLSPSRTLNVVPLGDGHVSTSLDAVRNFVAAALGTRRECHPSARRSAERRRRRCWRIRECPAVDRRDSPSARYRTGNI